MNFSVDTLIQALTDKHNVLQQKKSQISLEYLKYTKIMDIFI